MLKHYIGKRCLLTTQTYFVSPRGKECRAVWGTIKAIHEVNKDTLGIVPQRPHTNYVIEVGNMLIAGCQVMFCMECPVAPEYDVIETSVYIAK